MPLQPSEVAVLDKLYKTLESSSNSDELLLRYYLGRQRFEHIGLALPFGERGAGVFALAEGMAPRARAANISGPPIRRVIIRCIPAPRSAPRA